MAGSVDIGELLVTIRGSADELEAAIDKGNAKLGTIGPSAESASARASAAFSKWGARIVEVNQALDLLSRGKAAFDQFILGPLRAVDHLDKLSVRTGISVEKMGALSLGAQLAGTDLDELVQGVDRFARSLASAGDLSSDQSVLLKALGVTSRDTFPALEQLARGLDGIHNAAARTDIATTLMGRGGARLIAFLQSQSGGFAALEAQAASLGGTIDEKTSKAAVRLNDNITRVATAIGGVWTQAVVQLLPSLERTATGVEHWAEANRQILSTNVASWFKDFESGLTSTGEILDKLDIDKLKLLADIGKGAAIGAGIGAATGFGAGPGAAIGAVELPAINIAAGLVDKFFADPEVQLRLRAAGLIDAPLLKPGVQTGANAYKKFGGNGLDEFQLPGSGVEELHPSIGPGSGALQDATAQAQIANARPLSAEELAIRAGFQAQKNANLLAAEADGLKSVAAGKQLIVDRDVALGSTEKKLRADALVARDAELKGIAKQREAIQAQIAIDQQAASNKSTSPDAEKARSDAVEKLAKDQAALKDLTVQAGAANLKYDSLAYDSSLKQLAVDSQLAAIASERAANKATYLQQVLAEEHAMGETHAEQFDFSAQIDDAETTSLEAKRHSIELAKQQAEAQPEGVKRTIEVAGLSSELENVNLELSLAGHNVRSLQHEFINLGDTIRGATTDLVKNLMSGDFANAGQGFGKAFIDKFIESTIGEKLKNFDPQMKANLLEYIPGLGSLGGEKTGGNFIEALVSATRQGTGAAGGASFNDALLKVSASGTPDQAAQAQQLLSAAGYTPDQIQAATAGGTFGGAAPAGAPAGGGGGGGGGIQGLLGKYQQAKQLYNVAGKAYDTVSGWLGYGGSAGIGAGTVLAPTVATGASATADAALAGAGVAGEGGAAVGAGTVLAPAADTGITGVLAAGGTGGTGAAAGAGMAGMAGAAGAAGGFLLAAMGIMNGLKAGAELSKQQGLTLSQISRKSQDAGFTSTIGGILGPAIGGALGKVVWGIDTMLGQKWLSNQGTAGQVVGGFIDPVNAIIDAAVHQKGSGTFASRDIVALLNQLGIPGLNAPGSSGGYGGLDTWTNINAKLLPANYAGIGGVGAGVLMGAGSQRGWGKGGFNPTWASNAALNAAASLNLSPEDAKKIYNQFVMAGGGGNQEQALMANQAAFIRGGSGANAGGGWAGRRFAPDQAQYLATIKDIIKAYNDLVPAIDAASLATDAFNKDGQLQIAALGRAVKDAQTAIPAEMSSAIDVLLSGGTKYTAMRAAGAEAGKVFLDAFKTDLLQSDVFSTFMTKGSVELSQAAAAYASGDTAGGKTLATQAIKDVKAGSKQFVDFMALIAPSLRGLETSLGATPLARSDLINQTSLGLPSFDTGGIVPHDMIAQVHKGEVVTTAGGTESIVSLLGVIASHGGILQTIAGHLARGTAVTVTMDPRHIDRAVRDNKTLHRAGMSWPHQIGTK